MAGYSQDLLADELQRIKQRKAALAGNNAASPVASRDYRDNAPTYNSLAPQEMDTKKVVNPFAQQITEQIGRVSTQDTARSGVESQNKFNFQQLQQAQQELARAKAHRVKASKEAIQQPAPLKYPNLVNGSSDSNTAPNTTGTGPMTPVVSGGSSYYTQTPGWLDPNAGLTTFQAGGKTWTTNASVAGRFEGFINSLVGMGYKIKSAPAAALSR